MHLASLARTVRTTLAGCFRTPPSPRPIAAIAAPEGMPARRDVFPLLVAADRTLCFNRDCGPTSARVLATTVPKSGTYLLGQVLERLGFGPIGVQVYEDAVQDLRGQTRDEALDTDNVQVRLPIEQSLPLVRAGQYALGHVAYSERSLSAAKDFAVLFVYRDLRDCFVSLVRFSERLKRSGPPPAWATLRGRAEKMNGFLDEPCGVEWFMGLARGVVPWMTHPGVLPVRYETLLGDEGRESAERLVGAICRAVGVEAGRGRAAEVLAAAVSSETITKSSGRSKWTDYWDDRVEAKFRHVGAADLNRALGYS